MHEETRVEPGPIRPVRPAEYHFEPGLPVPEREREHILPVGFHGRWSYPSVFAMKDRVLIAHTYSVYEQHPTRAELILSSRKPGGFNQKLKVLPLTWFYGGKELVSAAIARNRKSVTHRRRVTCLVANQRFRFVKRFVFLLSMR